MCTLIFVLIYLTSTAFWLYDTYRENLWSRRNGVFTVGDLFELTPTIFYIPVINTVAIIVIGIIFLIIYMKRVD